MTNRNREYVLGMLTVGTIVAAFLVKPMAQPLSYHDFADQRSWLGIPNFWNVFSNFPFLLVGLYGLSSLKRGGPLVQFYPLLVIPLILWLYYSPAAGRVAAIGVGSDLVCGGQGF
jgi:hypothetical protein